MIYSGTVPVFALLNKWLIKQVQSYQLYLSKCSPPNNFNNLIILCFHAQIPDFINGFFIWKKKVRQLINKFSHSTF